MPEKDSQKTENVMVAEKIRNVKTFVPRVDIYETKDSIFLIADMPGVDENTVDVELEKNILTITGKVEDGMLKNHTLIFSEYEVGDYERSFTLSDEIDREKINATVKQGVLRLELPKAEKIKPKKIAIKAA
ncbi:MAG: Hsp20/alpha crystallin family protein [Smithellaceae bacterium]|jgi:HSP20 family molecular chaperone IbpA|nr:Hsp20/alpha crystallin family protein [Syntrophaceae bacterium]MBP8609552.1 Hsp20/alpha crystallin family protein [Syntrophaceae bacterium]NMD04771.1 Hsp20/alpha crystallin family protein [Deltaproteobacteria bacterium]